MFDNLFVLSRTILGSLRHSSDGNLLAAIAGLNDTPFFVDIKAARRGRWSQQRIAGMLGRKGIQSWGWGRAFGEYYFRVPRRRAAEAKAIMVKAGVPLKHAR